MRLSEDGASLAPGGDFLYSPFIHVYECVDKTPLDKKNQLNCNRFDLTHHWLAASVLQLRVCVGFCSLPNPRINESQLKNLTEYHKHKALRALAKSMYKCTSRCVDIATYQLHLGDVRTQSNVIVLLPFITIFVPMVFCGTTVITHFNVLIFAISNTTF
jgi:hypothetical protein